MPAVKVCFIGAGNMGGALIAGALKNKFLKSSQIAVFDVDPSRLQGIRNQFKTGISDSVEKAMEGRDYIFLCVKPQQMKGVLDEVARAARKEQCFISIAAGIPTETIRKSLAKPGFEPSVIRVMPNTPALVGCGMSVIASGDSINRKHIDFCKGFFSAVGEVEVLDEKYFDAVTAVSGSGPAYLFYLAEALRQAGSESGLPPAAAEKLARATLQGAAKLLKEGADPAELRKNVTSPGGTTEAAIRHLESQNWRQIFIDAIKKAKERSAELRDAQK